MTTTVTPFPFLQPTKSNSFVNAFVTPGLTYLFTALFISACLHTRAHVGTFLFITTLWAFAFLPLIYSAHGDLIRILSLLSQPKEYFQAYKTKGQQQPSQSELNSVSNFYSVVLTTFLFSIYIPLDSETILQEWPVAPMVGTTVGGLIGVGNAIYQSIITKQ